MSKKGLKTPIFWYFLVIFCAFALILPTTLLAAKANPEKYRDLVVRIAGYSAFFTTLSPDTQDDIIARTEHTLNL